jgi:hypothetical protein
MAVGAAVWVLMEVVGAMVVLAAVAVEIQERLDQETPHQPHPHRETMAAQVELDLVVVVAVVQLAQVLMVVQPMAALVAQEPHRLFLDHQHFTPVVEVAQEKMETRVAVLAALAALVVVGLAQQL